ncbi:MAG: 2-phospho-L-lactate guanylyltransferase [Gammaproteobacteria bacterium]|nr:MAG: 2-phospho-L-lactate guanylyltransferase [Gammaproteobacteria bacterium]RLA60155.1 MAG: 2-phospho-L-lactate guanylyltransferase [Gammaproteobacteria bacterium]
MAQALVPLKDLVRAKSRLAGLLRPSERRALAQAMVEDVLAVLSRHKGINRVTLVSDDPGAGLLAARYDIDHWEESSLGCSGLNPIVQEASTRLLALGDEPLLVLHGDLPLLTTADISAVLHCQRQLEGLVIGCDLAGAGTNLLAFTRASAPQFCFGVDSCARHLASARRAGVPVQVLQRSGIALDVDEPRDMHQVMAALDCAAAGKTFDLLHGSELGARVELALATLDDNRDLDKGVAN